jgi:thioredoxin reductase
MEILENNNEIKLTALQKAKMKYYQKIKNDPNYKAKIKSPESMQKRREAAKKFYYKIKDDEERAYKMLQIEEVYLKGKKSLNTQYTNLGLKDIKESNALMLKEIELNIKQQNEAY